MPALPSRALLAAAGCAALLVAVTGCADSPFAYSLQRYGTVRPVNVTLRCRDTYEVFDRPDAGTLAVSTNPVNEALVSCYDGGIPDLRTRQREVARIFFEEKTAREKCRILGETALSPILREFTYICPVPAAARPAGKA